VHNKRHKGAPHEHTGGKGQTKEPGKGQTKDPGEANANIRKARGDDATAAGHRDTDGDAKKPVPADSRRTGNRPAFDRDR
jgi:hypothetical protein